MAIINGRRINPDGIGNRVHGSELAREARAGFGRRPIIEKGGQVTQIDPGRFYNRGELIDKYGRGAKVTSMPDRSKGYGRTQRSAESRRIITEQVHDVAEKLFKRGVDFDEQDADWLIVPGYPLPENWRNIAKTTALLVEFPKDYPLMPPVGFYLPDDLPMAPDGHLFSFAAHGASDAPIRQNWKWYCVYINRGAWRPSRNWRHGDNLWTYLTLIQEALGSER
jgi:hypothetical protein